MTLLVCHWEWRNPRRVNMITKKIVSEGLTTLQLQGVACPVLALSLISLSSPFWLACIYFVAMPRASWSSAIIQWFDPDGPTANWRWRRVTKLCLLRVVSMQWGQGGEGAEEQSFVDGTRFVWRRKTAKLTGSQLEDTFSNCESSCLSKLLRRPKFSTRRDLSRREDDIY